MRPVTIPSLKRATCTAPGSETMLLDFIRAHPRLFILTGAGVSHASGIPTYRNEIGLWKGSQPIQHGDFMRSAAMRQRYWARSFVGWPNVARAQPNAAHVALVELERKTDISMLVTQNVDRLHQLAGQRRVTDLHGRLDQVLCMDCGALALRSEIQDWLALHNPSLHNLEASMAPDGDAEVGEELIRQINVPSCSRCGGLLKPNVVFYGSSVHKTVVAALLDGLQGSDALLVLGTSLMVFSSFRFCKYASEHAVPIACINEGLTRGDSLFSLKLQRDCGELLARVVESI